MPQVFVPRIRLPHYSSLENILIFAHTSILTPYPTRARWRANVNRRRSYRAYCLITTSLILLNIISPNLALTDRIYSQDHYTKVLAHHAQSSYDAYSWPIRFHEPHMQYVGDASGGGAEKHGPTRLPKLCSQPRLVSVVLATFFNKIRASAFHIRVVTYDSTLHAVWLL